MSEAFFRAGYYAKQRDIETLREWIGEAISKPSMSRELRLRGAEVVTASLKAEGGYWATMEDPLPKQVRETIERICSSVSRAQGRELEIER